MKSSNLARRVEPFEAPFAAEPVQWVEPASPGATQARVRPRTSFAHRRIKIRDQGFALFRVR